MRISRVETFILKIKAPQPYLGALIDANDVQVDEGYALRPPWRSLYSSRFETMLVCLTAEDGTEGWGEALAPVAPEVAASIVRLLLADVLLDLDPTSPRAAWLVLRDLMRERGHLVGHQADALAAVDIALWDLAAKLRGVRVVDLLGGAVRERIPAYVSGLPRPDNEGRQKLAVEWSDAGARRLKLHLGYGVREDLATFDAVQSAVPGLAIAVDAHWAYGRADARRLASELEARGAWFLEAPFAPEDMVGHSLLVASGPLPIAIGESLRNRYEFKSWLDAQALGIAQPDVARTGLTEAFAITELCAVYHVPVAPHHSTGLGVALAAGLHLSAATETLEAFEFQPSSFDVGSGILGAPMTVTPYEIALPSTPGLGVDVDRLAVLALAEES